MDNGEGGREEYRSYCTKFYKSPTAELFQSSTNCPYGGMRVTYMGFGLDSNGHGTCVNGGACYSEKEEEICTDVRRPTSSSPSPKSKYDIPAGARAVAYEVTMKGVCS